MAEEPEQLRHDIEGTRGQLSSDLDALTDRLNPSNVAQRQVDKAKAGVSGVKDRVFGAAHDAADSVAGAAGSGGGGNATTAVRRQTRGNPLAAGLIAFGAGWLLASLLPASARETEAAGALVEKATTDGAPLIDEVKATASDIGSSLGASAKDAALSVKESAQDAAATVQEDARSAAGTVGEHSSDAVQDVKGAAAR